MLNMLIRTRQNESKFKIATVFRIVMFFGIPFAFLVLKCCSNIDNHYDDNDLFLAETGISSRKLLSIVGNEKNCTPPAILEFPPDGFTRFQRQHGFIIIHCVLAVFCFLLLGNICEDYFVPAISLICERLNLASDVAGATFMAAASSSPELFINCVGTFVTEGDLGVGAIVGSAVFNVLAVPACCALFSAKVIFLDWWSVSRDCLMYAVAVVALILCLLDDKIYWHEALLLVLMYIIYILAMIFNGRLSSFFKSCCCVFKKPKIYTEVTPLLINEKNHLLDASQRMRRSVQQKDLEQGIRMSKRLDSTSSDTSTSSVWSFPGEKTTIWQKIFWILTWPINLILWVTVPDCRKRQCLYPLTFIMCIIWIGGTSYVVAWIITILGDTLDVPDSITGLTILAAGTSLPEAVSSVLVTKQGQGTMGLSNSIGSNTFDILLCLGLPWLVKSLFYPSTPGAHWVTINSSGLSYSAISLLSTLFALYGSLTFNKFQLDWKIGIICGLVYIGFIVLAVLIELNIFFVVNLPICIH